ncbi:TPA: hypothetical protein ACGRST_001576 [Escherichia coli]
MSKYIFSPGRNLFYPTELQALYENWPTDGIDVTDAVFDEFTSSPPVGQCRGVNSISGEPVWVDISGYPEKI